MAVETITARNFYTISNGKFARRVAEGYKADGVETTARVLTKGKNAGKTIYEVAYPVLGGIIRSVEFQPDEGMGANTQVTFEDGDVLTFKTDGIAGMGFLKMFPNIDLNEKIRLTLKQDAVKINGEDVITTSMFISQNGTPVKWAHTKDSPNGLPPTKLVKVNGKEVNDKGDQLDFLKSNVLSKIGSKPKVDEVQSDDNSEEKSEVPF